VLQGELPAWGQTLLGEFLSNPELPMISFCSETSQFLSASLLFWGKMAHGASSVRLQVAQFGTCGAVRVGSQPRSLGKVNNEYNCKLLHLVSAGIRKDKE